MLSSLSLLYDVSCGLFINSLYHIQDVLIACFLPCSSACQPFDFCSGGCFLLSVPFILCHVFPKFFSSTPKFLFSGFFSVNETVESVDFDQHTLSSGGVDGEKQMSLYSFSAPHWLASLLYA